MTDQRNLQGRLAKLTGRLDAILPGVDSTGHKPCAPLDIAEGLLGELQARLPGLLSIAKAESLAEKQEAWPEQRPLVSIVVAGGGPGDEGANATIDSVLAQGFRDIEIIVVGPSGSNPIREHPLLRHIAFEHIDARAWDAGVRYAFGKYVGCVCPGDRLGPWDLDRAVFALESMRLDAAGPAIGGHEPGPAGRDLLSQTDPLSTATLFRRACWEELGGIALPSLAGRPALARWGFWMRIAAAGGRLGLLDALTSEAGTIGLPSDEERALVAASRVELDRVQSAKRHGDFPRTSRNWEAFGTRFVRAGKPGPTVMLCISGRDRLAEPIGPVLDTLRAIGSDVLAIATESAESAASPSFGQVTLVDLARMAPEGLAVQFVQYLIASRNVDILLLERGAIRDEDLARLRKHHVRLKVAEWIKEGPVSTDRPVDWTFERHASADDYREALSRLWSRAVT